MIIPVTQAGFSQEKPLSGFEEEMKRMELERERMEQESLEELKKRDPKAYRERIEAREREKEKERIIKLYRENKLSAYQARQALRPFAEVEVRAENFSRRIDDRIKMFEDEIKMSNEEVNHLKRIKANPGLLIEEKINSYLGISREERSGYHR